MSTSGGKQLSQTAATGGTDRSGEARAPGSPVHGPVASGVAAPAARAAHLTAPDPAMSGAPSDNAHPSSPNPNRSPWYHHNRC
jgi:hypothetical protein